METKNESINTQTQNKNEPTDKEILAQNIAYFRKKLNLSQSELGKMIQYSNKNISKWEQGETTPDVFTLKKLASIFGVTLDTLTSPLSEEKINTLKIKTQVPLRWKVYMLLLTNSIIFLCSCILFFIFQSLNLKPFPLYYIFVYMLPLIDLSTFIFLCCIRKKVEIISLSIFGWLVTICLHISFLNYPNIPYIYFIAVAYQFIVIFMSFLINTKKIKIFKKARK